MLLACDSSIAVRDVARQKEGNDVQEKVGIAGCPRNDVGAEFPHIGKW